MGEGGGGGGGGRQRVVRQGLRRAAGRDALTGDRQELTLSPSLLLLLPLHPVALHVPLVLLPVLLHRLLALDDGDALLPPLTSAADVGNGNSQSAGEKKRLMGVIINCFINIFLRGS